MKLSQIEVMLILGNLISLVERLQQITEHLKYWECGKNNSKGL